ncbi:MAG: glucosaminidase domain-containing protein [Legionella sp.]|nr:glucosaminidase domain-containing protein [Legionella sp.]
MEQLDFLLEGAGVLDKKGAVFLKAAKDNNVNAIYLVAHALHESGAGDSPLAKDNNFFGLGAKDNRAKAAGADFAKKHGWTTVDEGIIGGAAIIAKQWINRPDKTQSTLYAMRWNPMNPGQKQYATDINWANAQAPLIYQQINRLSQIDSSYHPKYLVPKYR